MENNKDASKYNALEVMIDAHFLKTASRTEVERFH